MGVLLPEDGEGGVVAYVYTEAVLDGEVVYLHNLLDRRRFLVAYD